METTIKRDVAIAYRKYRAASEALVLYSTQILPRAEANLQTVRAAYGLGEFSVFEVVGEQRRLTENTTLPASGFTPGATVLPDEKDVPQQINRKNFLKSLQTPILAKKKNRVETAGIQKSN